MQVHLGPDQHNVPFAAQKKFGSPNRSALTLSDQSADLRKDEASIPCSGEGEASIPIDQYLSQAKSVRDDLVRHAKWANRLAQHIKERQWLSLNRKQYVGKWIALQGDQLLAVDDKSSEVFAAVSQLPEPPLVIKVEAEELPFAGW